jgi:hypothetical protein
VNSEGKCVFKNSTFSLSKNFFTKINDMQAVNRKQLFVASCLALLVTPSLVSVPVFLAASVELI